MPRCCHRSREWNIGQAWAPAEDEVKPIGFQTKTLPWHAKIGNDSSMPIRAQHRWLYPTDWPELSKVIRFDRAKGRCEQCARPHGRLILHCCDGRWFDRAEGVWRDGSGKQIAKPVGHRRVRMTKVVLAAAHLDHDPSNNVPANLKALCQRCHMLNDRDEHRRRRWLSWRMTKAVGDLFSGPYRFGSNSIGNDRDE